MGYIHTKNVRCAISRSLGKAKYHSRSQAPLEGLRVSASKGSSSVWVDQLVGHVAAGVRPTKVSFFTDSTIGNRHCFTTILGEWIFLLRFSNHLNLQQTHQTQQSGTAIVQQWHQPFLPFLAAVCTW